MAQLDNLAKYGRCAGIALPLFSLRTAGDRGIGDILDLIPMLHWAARMKQRFVQLLPMQETAPGEASPYAAVSAFGFDPLYIRVGAVPDMRAPSDSIFPVVDGNRLPREAIRDAKLAELETAWRYFNAQELDNRSERAERFERFSQHESVWLTDYALFRALKEQELWRHWREWPAGLRNREPEAMRMLHHSLADRIAFFQYVQWIAAEQWDVVQREARRLGVGLMGDLPFVIREDSADVWAQPELMVAGWEIGAPPDEFSAEGQNWGLPLYDWPRQRANRFAWWRERIRHARERFDLFRIDHIVGVFRTYSIAIEEPGQRRFHPEAEGEQIAQGEEFLSMVVEEIGAAVAVAEDLGTIPPFVREALHRHHIPGYKVLRWESYDGRYHAPPDYDPLSVATSGTHDTSTLAAWWGVELAAHERANFLSCLGLPNETAWVDGSFPPELRRLLLQVLYGSGSQLVIVPAQDLFGWSERINVPKTESAANWNYRLPLALGPLGEVAEEIAGETEIIADLVRGAGR